MIRLPNSVLALGSRDLVDYEERRQERELENVKQQFARFEIGAADGPKLGRSRQNQDSLNASESFETGALQSPNATTYGHSWAGDGYAEPLYPIFVGSDSSESNFSRVASPENLPQISSEVQRAPSPPKDGFHYGGYIESPVQHSSDNTPHRSSPFFPEDVSTPQSLLPPSSRARTRVRTLPRSPLYLSQNASSSPERRHTSSLTPRVASRVANHHTPGIIFAQPARRPATFRHQANSFSFDSSERSSAAYEQDRMSSLLTTDTTPRPSQDLRLHDELRGTSMTSSRVSSASEVQGIARAFIFSSPQLPPPFSTTSRRVSDAGSLPTSPVRSSELSSYETWSDPAHDRPNPIIHSRFTDSEIQVGSSPVSRSTRLTDYEIEAGSSTVRNPGTNPASRSTRLNDLFRSSASQIVSYYRPRSPSIPPSPRAQSMRSRHQTPSRYLTVYNDALPPNTQPQTPAHLPESRHLSRYHPAYTAPITRATGSGLGIFGVGNNNGLPGRYQVPPTTPSRSARFTSPVGLESAGMRGLYGGRENGDDEQSWVDGVRFNNAEVRLWGLRDAAGDGRTLGDTPEREEWRIGRH